MTLFGLSRAAFVAIALSGLCHHHAQAQAPDTASARATEDSLARKFIQPIPLVGSIDPTLAPALVVSESTQQFTDYRSLSDLIALTPGVLVREFASPGQYNDLTIQGIDARSIAYLSDGVQLNEPLSGVFNPYLYPTENIDRLEFVPPTLAFLYGLNSTGGAINMVSKSKKAIHPSSHLRYIESANGYSLVDGTISQDVSRGLNVTAGAQHATFGPRFPNDDYDQWNGRIKVRFNINNEINVFASEMYNQTRLGLNGGVDLTQTPPPIGYDPLQASVVSSTAYEKITRHDVQAGIAARFARDSNAVNTLTFSLSSNLREYRNEGTYLTPVDSIVRQNHFSQWMGARFSQHRTLGDATLDIAAEMRAQRTLVSPATIEDRGSLGSVAGKINVPLDGLLTLTPAARLERYRGQTAFSYGGNATLRLLPGLDGWGGYSRSSRFPTFQERSGTPLVISSSVRDETPERHHLLMAGFRWSDGNGSTAQASAFQRIIWNRIAIAPQNAADNSLPYVFTRHQKELLRGFTAGVSVHIGFLYLEGTGEFVDRTDADDTLLLFPRWSGSGGIYYWDTLFAGHLNLKVGFRGRAFDSYYGRQFSQQALVFLPNDEPTVIPEAGTGDFVLTAHLGAAYVFFIWENLLDREYVMTSFYPMVGRTIRFGVSWNFLD